jgi:integrase/recombinase XerD
MDTAYIDAAIAAWLIAKGGISGSKDTPTNYKRSITDFRAWLIDRDQELDLELWASRDDKVAWRRANAQFLSEVETFAAFLKRKEGRACPGTRAAKISAIRSFYEFAIDRGFFGDYPNPAAKAQLPNVEGNKIRPLDPGIIRDGMGGIDRTTLAGLRDYAVLCVFLETGRRRAEVASLRWKHVELLGDLGNLKAVAEIRLALNFERVKGGKTARHILSFAASVAVLECVAKTYEINPLYLHGDRPLWANLGTFVTSKQLVPLKPSGMAKIVSTRLGTTRVHRLRHTFAQQCLVAGLPLPDIAALLGHTNLATLTKYLESLSGERGENTALARLDAVFNIK